MPHRLCLLANVVEASPLALRVAKQVLDWEMSVRGWTLKDLAFHCGMSVSTAAHLHSRRGRARVYQATADDLLEGFGGTPRRPELVEAAGPRPAGELLIPEDGAVSDQAVELDLPLEMPRRAKVHAVTWPLAAALPAAPLLSHLLEAAGRLTAPLSPFW
jgi:transcriptional regulator with XRE-family HTH domain